MPNGLLDTIQADPDFARLTSKEKRIILGEALDRDPDYKVLKPTEQAQFRNEVYRRFGDTPREQYVAAPLTDPLGDPADAPKAPKLLPKSAPKPKAQPQTSVLAFRQKYVKPRDAQTEAAFQQFDTQYLTDGSKSTPAIARDYLRTLPLKEREAALEAHPQYRNMSDFGKAAILRSAYVLDNDAATLEKEQAKADLERQAAIGRERAILQAGYAAGIGGDTSGNAAIARKDKPLAKEAGKLQAVNAARAGTMLNQIVPGTDEVISKGKGVRGGLQKLAAGLVNSAPEMALLGAVGNIGGISGAIGKAFIPIQAGATAQAAADTELLKKDPAQYWTLLLGNAALTAAPLVKPAAKSVKRGLERVSEAVVPPVEMSGIGTGIPSNSRPVKPTQRVQSGSREVVPQKPVESIAPERKIPMKEVGKAKAVAPNDVQGTIDAFNRRAQEVNKVLEMEPPKSMDELRERFVLYDSIEAEMRQHADTYGMPPFASRNYPTMARVASEFAEALNWKRARETSLVEEFQNATRTEANAQREVVKQEEIRKANEAKSIEEEGVEHFIFATDKSGKRVPVAGGYRSQLAAENDLPNVQKSLRENLSIVDNEAIHGYTYGKARDAETAAQIREHIAKSHSQGIRERASEPPLTEARKQYISGVEVQDGKYIVTKETLGNADVVLKGLGVKIANAKTEMTKPHSPQSRANFAKKIEEFTKEQEQLREAIAVAQGKPRTTPPIQEPPAIAPDFSGTPKERPTFAEGEIQPNFGQPKPIEPPSGIPNSPKPAQVTQGEPAVADASRMRMRDVEALAAEMGIALEDKAGFKTTHRDVIERAMKNYEPILDSLKEYDPKKGGNPTPEERYVAATRQKEIKGELDTAIQSNNQGRIDVLLEESKRLSNLVYRAGSDAGRDLRFQQVVIGDKLDINNVLSRAEALTGENLSNEARRSLIQLVSKADKEKAKIDSEVQARTEPKATTQKRTIYKKVTADEYAAARKRFTEKTTRLSAGIDPTLLGDVVTIGRYHIEQGVTKFAEWVKVVRADVPDIDDKTLRQAWAQSSGEVRSANAPTLTERARKTLDTLGNPAQGRRQVAVDVAAKAEYEYAQGARDLDSFAKRVRTKLDGAMSDTEMKALFQQAAMDYARDYKSVNDIKTQMAKVVLDARYKAMPKPQKLLYNASNVGGIARSLMTSVDISAPGRQGAVLIGANPRMGLRGYGDMVRSYLKEDAALRANAEIKTRENYTNGNYEKHGLRISEFGDPDIMKREEAFRSTLAERIPLGVGKQVKASERAYTTFLNRLRADNFDYFASKLPNATDAELKAVADFVNAASGYGKLPEVAKGAENLLGGTFFSPRFVASRFQVLAGQPIAQGVAASNRTGYLIARTYLQTAASVAAVASLGQLAGMEMETDPRSKKFMKLRTPDGKYEVDYLAGLGQVMVYASQMATGESKSNAGKIQPLDGSEFPFDTRYSTSLDFLRGKAAPIPATAANLIEGKNMVGDKVNYGGELLKLGIPMSWSDVYKAAKDEGISPAAAVFLVNATGIGLRYNSEEEARERKRERAREAERAKYAPKPLRR